MTKAEPPPGGPINIGEEAKPPFAVLPDPKNLYLKRSKRFKAIAKGHRLELYLSFLGELTRTQHEIAASLPKPALPAAASISQALSHGMPPLGPASLLNDAAEATFQSLLAGLAQVPMPGPAAAAVHDLKAATPAIRAALLSRALTGEISQSDIAELSLASAALQVHASLLAAGLDADALKPIADGICPVCGSPPAASAVVGWPGAHNSRYCICSLCSTHWNVVRVKCVLCSDTGGIVYRTIEGEPDAVKAECCSKCRRYMKILYQVNHPELEEFADDVATVSLDILVREEDILRGGRNLFLLGY